MAIAYVDPTYKVIEKPRNLWSGDVPSEVEQALCAVTIVADDRKTQIWGSFDEFKYLSAVFNPAGMCEAVFRHIVPQIIYLFPKLGKREVTAYICPIISDSGEGYRRGFVVAENAEDALTVAEYMSGGRAEIHLELRDFDGELLGSDLLGDLGYADITGDTDTYQRVVKGDAFLEAAEEYLGGYEPEPQDYEFPGAEILAIFTKMS